MLDVERIIAAGSYRRRRETIGDLDLLAETDDARRGRSRASPAAVVEGVLGRGRHKAAVRLAGAGPRST